MKLYNLDHSPYATRVRMQIYKKDLDVSIVPPPVEFRTPAFVERFPLGKIPILELDDGSHLSDSWVIMEYLEDVMPAVSLCPQGATGRAQMQLLARYADTCLGPGGLSPLFALVTSGAGTAGAEQQVAALDEELARLERLLGYLPDFEQRPLHLGDIALAPHMEYVQMLAPMFGVEQPLQQYPRVAAWRDWVAADAAVAKGTGEMQAAVRTFFGG